MTGLGASVVLQMVSILETPSVHKIHFDDFFTGFALMKHLQDIDVRGSGTVRFNRMNKCPIANNKEMKKIEELMTADLMWRMRFWQLPGPTTTV